MMATNGNEVWRQTDDRPFKSSQIPTGSQNAHKHESVYVQPTKIKTFFFFPALKKALFELWWM